MEVLVMSDLEESRTEQDDPAFLQNYSLVSTTMLHEHGEITDSI
jgi:hypothetical protein